MSVAYLDTSFLLSILFGEPGSQKLRNQLRVYTRLLSSDLLVAETFAAATREGIGAKAFAPVLKTITLVFPDRSLTPEIHTVLTKGYLRGADLWHLACALFLAGPDRSAIAFLSRDQTQRAVASRLGFPTP